MVNTSCRNLFSFYCHRLTLFDVWLTFFHAASILGEISRHKIGACTNLLEASLLQRLARAQVVPSLVQMRPKWPLANAIPHGPSLPAPKTAPDTSTHNTQQTTSTQPHPTVPAAHDPVTWRLSLLVLRV